MINEKLRKKMTDAYADGDYKRALKLSQKLDKQILSHYSNKHKSKRLYTIGIYRIGYKFSVS